jgi:hypothetical protein
VKPELVVIVSPAAVAGNRARARIVAKVRRVADELIVVDSALREQVARVELQERTLKDGSRWDVYKRYFTPDALSAVGAGLEAGTLAEARLPATAFVVDACLA